MDTNKELKGGRDEGTREGGFDVVWGTEVWKMSKMVEEEGRRKTGRGGRREEEGDAGRRGGRNEWEEGGI